METFVDNICKNMNMTYSALSDLLSAESKNYTAHTQKSKGKVRTVYEPSDILRKLQVMAVDTVFSGYPVSACSTAYERGCSILKNAKEHQKSKFLVRFDIKDFFGSIKYWHFEVLLDTKFDAQDIKLLWKICSLNNALPVGAYSSSFVANRIMYNFDNIIAKRFKGVKYTRYADDMIFSSDKELPEELESELKYELSQARFELNNKKTRAYNEKTPKKVTGITITPDNKLTVGKRYKLAIKKQLYDYITKNKGNKKKIIGKLNYIKFVSPQYFDTLVKKYRLYDNLLKYKNNSHDKPWHRPSQTVYNITNESARQNSSPGGYGYLSNARPQRKQKSLLRRILTAFIIMFSVFTILSLTVAYFIGRSIENGTVSPKVQEIKLTTQNYSEYINIYRNYAVNHDYSATFSLSILGKTGVMIENLTVEFNIEYEGESIFADIISFDEPAMTFRSQNYSLSGVHWHFADYVFDYIEVTGNITKQNK